MHRVIDSISEFTGRSLLPLIIVCGGLLLSPICISAQAQEEEKKIPPVEDISITTKDGVVLKCSWYAGTKGKESVPIVLLHGWEENRQVYRTFAASLQTLYGHAVLIPDLRGHGGSTVTANDVELDLSRFGRREYASISEDIEQCRRFLQKKNNEGELNLEQLVVVSAEETTLVATAWAIQDWSWPDYNGEKQGKFVKALVMISPKKSHQGLNMSKLSSTAIMSGRGARAMPIMIAVGSSDDKVVREAKQIESIFKKRRPPVRPEGETKEERQKDMFEKQTVFYAQYGTKAEGTELLNKEVKLAKYIASFVKLKVGSKASDFAWHELPK